MDPELNGLLKSREDLMALIGLRFKLMNCSAKGREGERGRRIELKFYGCIEDLL